MKLVVQRSLNSSVSVNNKIVGEINHGYVVVVGFNVDDSVNDIDYLINKLINLRIFEDREGKMNLSIKDVGGSILSISQFTLYADVRNGNRPSFTEAMSFDKAKILYDIWNHKLKEKIAQYERMEATLNKTIMMAQKTSEQVRVSTQRESEAILEDAKRNANRIVNEALLRAEKAEEEANMLRRNINIFKRRVRDIVEAQLEVVSEMDHVEL